MNKRDTIIAVVLLVVTVGMFYGIFYFKNHYLEEKNSLTAELKAEQEKYDNLELQVRGRREPLVQEKEQLLKDIEALPTYEDYKVIPYVDDGELLYLYDQVLSNYYINSMSVTISEPEVNDRNEAVVIMTANLTMREADYVQFLDDIDAIGIGHRTINAATAYSGYDASEPDALIPIVTTTITTEFYCYYDFGYVDPHRDYPYSIDIMKAGTMFARVQRNG